MTYFSFVKIILSSLFKKSATVSYPIKPLERDSLARGRVENEVQNCIFCGICAKKCPTGAIKVDRNDKQWEIARFDCIVCNSCVEVCPKKCLRMSSELTPASYTMVKDTEKAAE